MLNPQANKYESSIDTELLSTIVECLETILDRPLLGEARFELECELNEYIPYCTIMNKAVLS